MSAPPKIRAVLCLENGAESKIIEVETVETFPDNESIHPPGFKTAWEDNFKPGFQSHAVWNQDDKSQPDFKLTPLPCIQPKCPKEVEEKAWNKRMVIGNADFHMILTPKARKDWLSLRVANVDLPLASDALILKVSPNRDATNRWKYECMGPDSPQLFDQLKSFVEEVKDVLGKAGFE